MAIQQQLKYIQSQLPNHVTLIAVSKTKPNTAILEAYEAGQRLFGENKVQELVEKHDHLPKDISWHMIGHLQRNKVKYIAEFVDLIHGVDNLKLLQEINKQALKHNRIIRCLLQVKIAQEDTKFGMLPIHVEQLLQLDLFKALKNIKIVGLMGMATFTENDTQIKTEFNTLKQLFNHLKSKKTPQCDFSILSMGMSGDYKQAIECGSTMVRIGSHIFGSRNYTQ